MPVPPPASPPVAPGSSSCHRCTCLSCRVTESLPTPCALPPCSSGMRPVFRRRFQTNFSFKNASRIIGLTLSRRWMNMLPFALHLGWISVATVANINISVVAYNASPPAQIAAAILTLFGPVALALWSAVYRCSRLRVLRFSRHIRSWGCHSHSCFTTAATARPAPSFSPNRCPLATAQPLTRTPGLMQSCLRWWRGLCSQWPKRRQLVCRRSIPQ
jgi:hypothetical protein